MRFRYGYKKYLVTCNEPMTIQERLQTDSSFKAICEKNQLKGNKEIVILRENPRAAVVSDFPCCLLDENELLDIKFIKAKGSSGPVKTQKFTVQFTVQSRVQSREEVVSFYIKTRGDEGIHVVMKNNELKKTVDEVCVWGVKGEKLKAALKRDGRFKGVVLSKGVLYEHETENMVGLSTHVDFLGGKHFIIRCSPYQTGSQESSQEMSQESETPGVKDEKSEVPETPLATNSSQDSSSTREKKAETPQQEKTPKKKYPNTKKIPDTGEILKLLREQHKDLLKTLKERENLKNNVEVKRFFREEYDKSAQSFTEVKKVKSLMKLSDSVCQIRTDGSPLGTGFLLFDRFVLTNAHVVENINSTRKMEHKLTAVFGFEDLDSKTETKIELEHNVVAFLKGKDDMGKYLDFALLKLSGDEKLNCPKLLGRYSPPAARGGVCIIGHPEGGIKRMDPCFMIAKEDRERAAEEHYENNQIPQVYHVITQQCLNEDRELRESQITYDSCFFHGSSGSPVFDDHCNLIGVHTGGYCYEEGKKKRSVMEYALPMLPILVQICIQCYRRERSDVVNHITSQNNMKYVVQKAEELLQKKNQASDIITPMDLDVPSFPL